MTVIIYVYSLIKVPILYQSITIHHTPIIGFCQGSWNNTITHLAKVSGNKLVEFKEIKCSTNKYVIASDRRERGNLITTYNYKIATPPKADRDDVFK